MERLRALGQVALFPLFAILGVLGGLAFLPLTFISLIVLAFGHLWLALVLFVGACGAARLAILVYETGIEPRWPAVMEAAGWAALLIGGGWWLAL